jgi:hypothetical protein
MFLIKKNLFSSKLKKIMNKKKRLSVEKHVFIKKKKIYEYDFFPIFF